ncbi:hypothetical protein D1115_12490 [Vibrio alfacsensis]|uniref:Uncharacterized protein n=1 Tax=Vibrio alfacsensis TaxID=1074311 RepID=A0ABN5PF06_9VIBR|nr:hypothetical protein D1115_12490 [Vibrio alfacsensis]
MNLRTKRPLCINIITTNYDTFVTFENKFSYNFLLGFILIFCISIRTSTPKFPIISTSSSSLEKIYVV